MGGYGFNGGHGGKVLGLGIGVNALRKKGLQVVDSKLTKSLELPSRFFWLGLLAWSFPKQDPHLLQQVWVRSICHTVLRECNYQCSGMSLKFASDIVIRLLKPRIISGSGEVYTHTYPKPACFGLRRRRVGRCVGTLPQNKCSNPHMVPSNLGPC